MTAPQPDPNVLEFTSDINRPLTDSDLLPFRLDGATYTLIRPKQAVLVELVTAGEQLQVADLDHLTGDDLVKVGHVVERFLINVEQPGQGRLRRRLADPRDGLDLVVFLPMIQDVVAALVPRPTSAQPASS